MAILYRRFDGARVSRPWFRLLTDLRAASVQFFLNSGHRTMNEQAALVREKGLWSPSNPTGAAAPSPTAPHIRVGRLDHACDFVRAKGAPGGAPEQLLSAAAKRGVTLTRTVPGETWHLEANAIDLLTYWQRRNRQIAVAAAKRAVAKARLRVARLRRRHVSRDGLALIAEFEGVRTEPYNDPVGFATIGVGHLIARRPVNAADRAKYKGFTRADAFALLSKDVRRFERPVRRYWWLNQAQFDSIVSAVFNLGPGVLDPGRSLGETLRSKDPARVADALMLYDRAGRPPRPLPGLTRRRTREAEPFRKTR